MTYRRILVTGFKPAETRPSDTRPQDTSWIAAESLDPKATADAQVRTLVLPTDLRAASRLLVDTAASFEADAVVCFAMAPESRLWRVELVARVQGAGARGAEGDPPILPTGLPVARIHGRLLDAGFAAEYSNDVGSVELNQFFHRALSDAVDGRLPAATGLVRTPGIGAGESASDDGEILRDGARVVIDALARGAGDSSSTRA